jgi:hypothetical protein
VISRDVELLVLMEAVSPLGMNPEQCAGHVYLMMMLCFSQLHLQVISRDVELPVLMEAVSLLDMPPDQRYDCVQSASDDLCLRLVLYCKCVCR